MDPVIVRVTDDYLIAFVEDYAQRFFERRFLAVYDEEGFPARSEQLDTVVALLCHGHKAHGIDGNGYWLVQLVGSTAL